MLSKRFLSLIWGTLLLGLQTALCAATSYEVPERSALALGDGIDPVTMEASSACVKGSWKTSRVLKTEYFVDSALGSMNLIEKMFRPGRFNSSSWSESILDRIYRSYYTPKRRTLYYLVKVSDSESTLENLKFDQLRIQQGSCGQAWVDRIMTGGYVLLSLHLDFVSESDAQKVANFAQFETLSMSRLQTFLQTLSFDLSDGVQLSFEMEQVGGDPDRLLTLFRQDRPVLSCRFPNITGCLDVLDAARNYMVSPQEFVGQFLGNSSAPVRYISLQSYQAEARPWDALILQRDELGKVGRGLQAAIRRQEERLRLARNTPMQATIEQGLNSLRAQWDGVKLLRSGCFTPGAACRFPEQSLPDRVDIIGADGFLEYCNSKYKAASLNIFVDFLQRTYGSLSCSAHYEKVSTVNELSLSGLMLDQLSFLSGLNYLERIDLSGNQLVHLDSLPYLPRLYDLNLDRNQLTSLKGLERAPGLMKLQLDRNQLKTIDLPMSLQKLSGLRALGNPLLDINKERQRLKNVPALYLSPLDICAIYRQWALDHSLVGKEDFDIYSQLGFAPVFTNKVEKGGIQNWVNCEAAYTGYVEKFPGLELIW